jgi:hypothetical protein
MPVMKVILVAFLLSAAVASNIATASQAPLLSTTLSVRGRIETFERSAGMLSLATPHGTVHFHLESTTRIRRGWRKIDASDLLSLTGDRATVRYTESDGHRLVESVHVFRK